MQHSYDFSTKSRTIPVIDGIIIDNKPLIKKKTLNSLGVYCGYGLNYTPGGIMTHGLQAGVGYSFGFVNWC